MQPSISGYFFVCFIFQNRGNLYEKMIDRNMNCEK